MKRKLCKDCVTFIKKYKSWNEKKVPKIALVKTAECHKCRMSYNIYKGMIQSIPMATRKEIKEINKQCSK